MPEGKFISCIYPVHIFYITGVEDVAKEKKRTQTEHLKCMLVHMNATMLLGMFFIGTQKCDTSTWVYSFLNCK